MFTPATPMAISRSVMSAALSAFPPPVSMSAMTGMPHRAHDIPGMVEDVLHFDQAHVGPRQQAPRQPESAHLHRLETRALDDPRAQRVVATRHHQRLSARQFLFQD